jgi:hypothetical protein
LISFGRGLALMSPVGPQAAVEGSQLIRPLSVKKQKSGERAATAAFDAEPTSGHGAC